MEVQPPPQDFRSRESLPWSGKNAAKFFLTECVRTLKAAEDASVHLSKGAGLGLLADAAWSQTPTPIKENMVLGGLGLLTLGEVLDMRRHGELRSLFETAKAKGAKEAAQQFIKRRLNIRFATNTLATTGLILAAEAGGHPPYDLAERVLITSTLGTGAYTSIRMLYHNFMTARHALSSIFHGVGTASGALGMLAIVANEPGVSAKFAMAKSIGGDIVRAVNGRLGRQ